MFLTMLSSLSALLLSAGYFVLKISPMGTAFLKPLSAADEELYLTQLAAGDREAKNKLIEHNLRLVAHVIKKYYTSTGDQDDLLSIGTIGLIKAINSFKTEKGTRLATYAARCIENEILMYFRSLKKSAGDISLSENIDSDKDGNSLSLVDILSCEDNSLEQICKNESYCAMYHVMERVLDKREQEILSLRFGLYGQVPLTQREVAQRKVISRSYVSRIEKKALEKLREQIQPE